MILLIDNYDSFSYNLYQMIGEIEPDIRVIRNDEMTVEQISRLKPSRIILSPGPGRRKRALLLKRPRNWAKPSLPSAYAWATRRFARRLAPPSPMQRG